ncbi:MAG: hypothetical protein V3W22_00600 [Thermoplasmata archaeon]
MARWQFACKVDPDEDSGRSRLRIAMRMNQSIQTPGGRCEGINLFLADGEAAVIVMTTYKYVRRF